MAKANDLQATNLTIQVEGKTVLKEITHQFQAGTITLILGRSGSGKTMLLEALSGLREIQAGEVFIGDIPLWKGTQTRKKIQREAILMLGTGFQHPEQQLFARTVEAEFNYNLRPYRLSTEQRKQKIEATTYYNPQDSADWLKLDPFKLSGGQKRRLTLAILEATAPDWLLLDEPTSGVDTAGVAQLCQQLKLRQSSGQGTIVITHDLDGLIEAANNIILMKEGQLYWSGGTEELLLHPDIMEAVGLALPSHLETNRMLEQAGFNQPSGWPDAITAAKAIALKLTNPQASGQMEKRVEYRDDYLPALNAINSESDASNQFVEAEREEKSKNHLKSFDPRTVWLIYILLSSGILLQSSWYGWLASSFVAASAIFITGVTFKAWFRPAFGLIIFAGIAAFISGIILGKVDKTTSDGVSGLIWNITPSIHFAFGPASLTFYHFSRLVMIMLIGFVLLSSINHLLLKRALEQGLNGLRFLRLPIEQFALTASLMIRFLPLLMNEWNRFARIAAARGKYTVQPGRIPIRGLQMTVIPYLMSVIRLGELLSLILILRGIGLAGRRETRSFRLTFHKADYMLVLAAAGVLFLLILVKRTT